MKKIVCMVIALIFVLNASVFAEGTDVLKLEDVIKKAVEGSRKLEIDDLNISNSQKVYNSAVKDAENMYVDLLSKSYLDEHTPEIAEYISNRKEDEILPDQRKNEYDYTRKVRQMDENALVLDSYATYYNLLKLNKEIELKTKELALIKTSQNESYNKYRKGLISKNDYRLVQLNTKSSEMKLNSLKRNKKKTTLKLYNLMNLGYNPDIKPLAENLEYTKLEVVIEDVIKEAFENRADLFKLEKEYEIRELEFELMKEIYDEDDVEYVDAENNLEETELNIDVKKQDIEFELRSSYNEILNLYDNIEIAQKDLEKAKISYDEALLKKDLGMMTNTQVQNVELEYSKFKLQLDSNIMDYIIAVKKFEIAHGIG